MIFTPNHLKVHDNLFSITNARKEFRGLGKKVGDVT
jgi:hypothetical protein